VKEQQLTVHRLLAVKTISTLITHVWHYVLITTMLTQWLVSVFNAQLVVRVVLEVVYLLAHAVTHLPIVLVTIYRLAPLLVKYNVTLESMVQIINALNVIALARPVVLILHAQPVEVSMERHTF
jgi:hypothetical protein